MRIEGKRSERSLLRLFTRAGKAAGMVKRFRCNQIPIKATPFVAQKRHCEDIIVCGTERIIIHCAPIAWPVLWRLA